MAKRLTSEEMRQKCFPCWLLGSGLAALAWITMPVLSGYGAFALVRDSGLPYMTWYVTGLGGALLGMAIQRLYFHIGQWSIKREIAK